MATYVLVAGAWLGGWAWRDVARDVRARGHEVYPVTLTGLGERAHLARPEIDLETHITDVVNVLEYEDLRDVVLVGHSYAASVITGVADRAGDRLAKLVYLDSAPFENGMALLDLSPPEAVAAMRRQVAEEGDGWRFPFPTFEALGADASLEGLDDTAREDMRRKAVAQPFRTYEQPLRLGGPGGGEYGRVIVACNDFQALLGSGHPMLALFKPPAWQILELPTGHWPMFSLPRELAALLHGLAPAR